MDKNIPLSELIRIGSKVSEQCKRTLSRNVEGHLQTCAIGAAYLARFGEPPVTEFTYKALHDCGVDPTMFVRHPNAPRERDQLFSVIANLNDIHGWSREQIADWLEQEGL